MGILKKLSVPQNVEQRSTRLRNLLKSLDSVSDIRILEDWLKLIVNSGLSPETGIPPDSSALDLFVRILDLDFSTGLAWFDRLLTEMSTPWIVAGHFQLSLVGGFLANIRDKVPSQHLRGWAKNLVAASPNRIGRGVRDVQTRSALVASILAMYFLIEDNSVTGAQEFSTEINRWLKGLEGSRRRHFLQFFVDTLGQFVNEKHVRDHWFKLLILCALLKDEPVVWPNVDYLGLLRDAFLRPAEEIIHK